MGEKGASFVFRSRQGSDVFETVRWSIQFQRERESLRERIAILKSGLLIIYSLLLQKIKNLYPCVWRGGGVRRWRHSMISGEYINLQPPKGSERSYYFALLWWFLLFILIILRICFLIFRQWHNYNVQFIYSDTRWRQCRLNINFAFMNN